VRRSISLLLVSAVAAAVLGPAAPPAAEATPGTIFEDDFEGGDLSNWDTVATHRFAVTSNPLHVRTGSYALEGTIDDGSPGSINKWFLPGYDEVYVRFDVMFEPGFQNLRGDGHGMHLASIKGNRIDDKWSSHGKAGITPDGSDFFVTTVDPAYRRDDPTLRPLTFYAYFPDMVPKWGNLFYQFEPSVPIIPGQWHEIIIHIAAGTPGQHDGSQALLDRRGQEDRGQQHAVARYRRAAPERVRHRRLHAGAAPDPAHLVRQRLGRHHLSWYGGVGDAPKRRPRQRGDDTVAATRATAERLGAPPPIDAAMCGAPIGQWRG